MPHNTDFEVEGVNGWLALQGIDHPQSLEQSEELLESSENEVERATGLSFDEPETVSQDGTAYHIGSYLNADGEATLRFVECDGAIHWPTPYMSQIASDFLAGYSK